MTTSLDFHQVLGILWAQYTNFVHQKKSKQTLRMTEIW